MRTQTESSTLIHSTSRIVERGELLSIPAPEATATWFPLSHGTVLATVEQRVADAGFSIERASYALARNDQRFFGTLDLASPIAAGVKLAVGIRNSCDKSLPIGFAAGSRVFVCDNLAFSGEVVVARKHTRYGEDRFAEALSRVVMQLAAYRDTEMRRVERLAAADVTDTVAESLILRSFEKDIISTRQLPDVIQEWREPRHDEFRPRTLWSLFNAFTEVMKPRAASNPQQFAGATIQLTGLFSQAAGLTLDAEPCPMYVAA